MTTLVKPREIQTPIKRVKPAIRPAAPTSAVQIGEEYHTPATAVEATRTPLRRVPENDGVPLTRKMGVWAALLAKINGPAVTQRERTRQEAYEERLKGNGVLTRFMSPRS